MKIPHNLLASIILTVCTLFISPVHAAPEAPIVTGKITEVIAAAGYTYVEIDTGNGKVWAAGPVTNLKVGDRTGFETNMPMANFHSKAMNRDFRFIYFVNSYLTEDGKALSVETKDLSGGGSMSGAMGGGGIQAPASVHAKTQPAVAPSISVAKAEGGQSIAEVYAQKADLKGKTIHVRGQVTKYTASVMGKNWLHIVDGSGKEDLTVVTNDTVAVGDLVVIDGTLAIDKDFEFGYFYPVIVEDAKVTKE